MFDKRNAQVEILREMFNTKRRPTLLDIGGKIGVTTNGYYAYIFDESELFIDTRKLRKTDFAQAVGEFTPERQLRLSKVTYEANPYLTERVLVAADGTQVVVNDAFLRKFSNCVFYGDGALSPVFCVNGVGGLCGMVLPLRVTNDFVEKELHQK